MGSWRSLLLCLTIIRVLSVSHSANHVISTPKGNQIELTSSSFAVASSQYDSQAGLLTNTKIAGSFGEPTHISDASSIQGGLVKNEAGTGSRSVATRSDQRNTPIATAMPESGMLALLGAGLIMLGVLVKKVTT